ncbi:MAG: hypothetical protein GX811_07520, partial [Lentisphaerae bacterium]|nr:hypothetical protein [Lentisphaerota bacterium]
DGKRMLERRGRDSVQISKLPDNYETIVVRVFKKPSKAIHPFWLGKVMAQCSNYSSMEVTAALNNLNATYRKLVRSNASAEILLETALIKICAKPRRAGRA